MKKPSEALGRSPNFNCPACSSQIYSLSCRKRDGRDLPASLKTRYIYCWKCDKIFAAGELREVKA